MNSLVVAAVITGALTVIGTLLAQYFGRRATGRDLTEQREQLDTRLKAQREQLDTTLKAQREQLDTTLEAQSEQLSQTLTQQRERTLNERFATAAEQLGSDKPATRVAGVYAMAGLADDWLENRQICVDVLCAYLRMPYDPEPGADVAAEKRLYWKASREVRHTVIGVIGAHLNGTAPVSWCGLNFDFTGVVFDGGNFAGAKFSGGTVDFTEAVFSGGMVHFLGAKFSGGTVDFRAAKFPGATVNFHGAKFSGGKVDFNGAAFSGAAVSFNGAVFSGATVDFSWPASWTLPPSFGLGFDVSHPPAGLILPTITGWPSPGGPVR